MFMIAGDIKLCYSVCLFCLDVDGTVVVFSGDGDDDGSAAATAAVVFIYVFILSIYFIDFGILTMYVCESVNECEVLHDLYLKNSNLLNFYPLILHKIPCILFYLQF